MKRITLLFFTAFFCITNLKAQTFNPSCYSNVDGWTITKIENNYDGTYVHLNVYTHQSDYEFWIVPDMYIENYNNPGIKYRIKSFMNNKFNTRYSIEPMTNYNFTLKFERIPSSWTDINIKEPYQGVSSTTWYWNYISLNKNQSHRLKIDNFFLNNAIKFLASVAHPFDTFKSANYTVDYSNVKVTIYYNGGYYTHINIKKNGSFLSFSRNDVVDYNCTLCDPFMGVYLLKQTLLGKNNYEEYETKIERYIGKTLNDMDGYDLTSFILTLAWLDYNNN
ncbi:MAG: hypothetical protein JXR05_13085 [Flavobacteriaceae bacterium]